MVVGDALVVTQKIVSKAEGRFIDLADITAVETAIATAAEEKKDPRLVEMVLRESSGIVRKAPNVLITRHHLGHVMANVAIGLSGMAAVIDRRGEPDRDGRPMQVTQAALADAIAAAARTGLIWVTLIWRCMRAKA
jgi:coenzyme F420-0:L-glutamate ligase / coenzyme F420-1:gamma-L-glutamate ligase